MNHSAGPLNFDGESVTASDRSPHEQCVLSVVGQRH